MISEGGPSSLFDRGTDLNPELSAHTEHHRKQRVEYDGIRTMNSTGYRCGEKATSALT